MDRDKVTANLLLIRIVAMYVPEYMYVAPYVIDVRLWW